MISAWFLNIFIPPTSDILKSVGEGGCQMMTLYVPGEAGNSEMVKHVHEKVDVQKKSNLHTIIV